MYMAGHCLVEWGSNTKVCSHCNAVTHAPAAHYARGDGSNVLCGATQASINDLILLPRIDASSANGHIFHDVAQACDDGEAILRCQREHLPFQLSNNIHSHVPTPTRHRAPRDFAQSISCSSRATTNSAIVKKSESWIHALAIWPPTVPQTVGRPKQSAKKNAETHRRIGDYSNASNMPKKKTRSKKNSAGNRAISRSRAKSCAVKPSRAFQI